MRPSPKLEPAEVPSPCTKVCRMEGPVCAGCGRTLDEIARWRSLGADDKRAVLARLAAQKAASWPHGQP